MELTRPCPAAGILAQRIRESRDELASRWLERIAARSSMEPERVFPTDELLDRVPLLLEGVAAYLEDPADEIAADMPVVANAMKLGELRFAQGFDAVELLKEYEILGGVLYAFCARVASEMEDVPPECLMVCGHRLFRAVSVIEQFTAARYLRVMAERIGEREDRLRRFGRMLTHELKNRVGATLGAGQLLQEDWIDDAERRRFATMVMENAQAIQKVLENLIALSRVDEERRRQRNILLREVVKEVFRQLRELARARQVELQAADDLPSVEVNAAAVEMCLANYVSNAIKYSDPERVDRWARVDAELRTVAGGGAELVVRVLDNGIGVPRTQRGRLFQRFFRAHEGTTAVEGTGLGLSLVQEMAESLGGRAWAEFPGETGAAFMFALPCRSVEGAAGGLSCDGAAVARAVPNSRADAARATASDSQP